MELAILPATSDLFPEIIELLSASGLPTEDVFDNQVQLFEGIYEKKLAGCIGIEAYNGVGLLRSLAVQPNFKNLHFGRQLVSFLFDYCKKKEIPIIYLLTTTADKYFEKLGFITIDRKNVPDQIQQTREFKDICPQSSIVMHRKLQ